MMTGTLTMTQAKAVVYSQIQHGIGGITMPANTTLVPVHFPFHAPAFRAIKPLMAAEEPIKTSTAAVLKLMLAFP